MKLLALSNKLDPKIARNDSVHQWYRSVMGFSPSLVKDLILKMDVNASGYLLDPFCGTGTTLVEAKFSGIPSIGVDSNPFFVATSWAKTYWRLEPKKLLVATHRVLQTYQKSKRGPAKDFQLKSASVVSRGWLRPSVWWEARELLDCIYQNETGILSRILALVLTWAVKEWASNVRFGPEAYKITRRDKISVSNAFEKKISQVYTDLINIPQARINVPVRIFHGDSRDIVTLVKYDHKPVKWVITSPPYPTEHDYTRVTRIELELLDLVKNSQDLRKIKQIMLRSNSKNIYISDNDYELVRSCKFIRERVDFLKRKAQKKNHGFAKQYPKVVGEYFGGLYRHMLSLSNILPAGAKCAYVVGQQCSYLDCFIPTGEIIAKMCKTLKLPFEKINLIDLRTRRGTRGTRRPIKEQVLLLRRTQSS